MRIQCSFYSFSSSFFLFHEDLLIINVISYPSSRAHSPPLAQGPFSPHLPYVCMHRAFIHGMTRLHATIFAYMDRAWHPRKNASSSVDAVYSNGYACGVCGGRMPAHPWMQFYSNGYACGVCGACYRKRVQR